MRCSHTNFLATVTVAKIEDVGKFMAEIKISCAQCNTPFAFMGLSPGLNFDGATVSLDGLEANIAIYPEGERFNPMQQLMGYTVTHTN